MNRVLVVTGGAGFIGSAFVKLAVKKGYSVYVIDCLTYAGDVERLKDIEKGVTFIQANICQNKRLDNLFKSLKPLAIFHFAAETHVDRSILDGQVFLQTNVLGTQHLLELARKYAINNFIHISTDEVYGEISKGQFHEKSPFSPNSPYAVSKASADMLVMAYGRTYGLPVKVIRACNNYGPWQYPEKLLPVVMYKAYHHLPVPVYGQGQQMREWLFVEDCAEGIWTVFKKGKNLEAYNLGSGYERKNIDIVRAVLKKMNRPADLIEYVKDRPGHDWRYALNINKITQLGFKPRVDLDKGLDKTIAWYLSHQTWLNKKAKSLSTYWARVYQPLKNKGKS